MAGDGGAEEETATEYESDPEEANLSLKMRRREASDDEEEPQEEEADGGGGDVEEREIESPAIGVVDSEGESDGQGAAADYDDEDEDGEEYYDEEEYEEVEEREGGDVVVKAADEGGSLAKAKGVEGVDEGKEDGKEKGDREGEGEGEEEEKKEAEPFAVPTSGAFYMHDDRFRDNAAGRNRRTFGGRKLWESKDESKWGHDKFEELHTHDRHYDEGRRSSKGNYRGCERATGAISMYPRGGRGRGYSGNSNQSAAPKDVRGRGPKKYQPSMRNKSDFHPPHNKQSARSFDKNSHTGFGRAATAVSSTVEHESSPAKKLGSNLSSASPPFYPLGASNKDVSLSHRNGVQAGNNNRNMRPSTAGLQFPVPPSNSVVRGKDVIDTTGMEKLRIDDSVSPPGAKPINNMPLRSASSLLSPNQLAHPRGHGRGLAPTGSVVFQPIQATSQVNKVSPQAAQANQNLPAQTQSLSPLQSPGQQLVQRSVGVSQSSSPPKSGKGSARGNARGSLVYGGAQVTGSGGNVAAGHGDPNIPAFFPVMQFGGQHPGGIPAVGMAFPGYVAQPNSLGNSEMTWLPVLANAAGAMGATFPPYLAVDGNYHPRPTGQTSTLPAHSKDRVLSKPNNGAKAHQRSEVANDVFSLRQNKPRRYSEMSFSQ